MKLKKKFTTLRVEATKKNNVVKQSNDSTPQISLSNTMPLRTEERTKKLTNSLRKTKHDHRSIRTTHDKDRNDAEAESMAVKTKVDVVRKLNK